MCVYVCAGELSDDAYRLKRHHPTLKPMHMATDKDDIKIEYRDDYGRVMVSFRTHTDGWMDATHTAWCGWFVCVFVSSE